MSGSPSVGVSVTSAQWHAHRCTHSKHAVRVFIRRPDMSACCAVCGIDEHDHLCMLCDSCDRGFHTYCVGLGAMVPPGTWYCPDCHIPEMLPPEAYEDDDMALSDVAQQRAPQRRAHTLAPALHPTLQRASRPHPVPVARRTQRTAPTHARVSRPQLIGAAHHQRVRDAYHARTSRAADPDAFSGSEEELETMADRRQALARDTARDHARAVAVPANRALAHNRNNWEDIRAGVTDFSDPVGSTIGRRPGHDAAQAAKRAEAVAAMRAGNTEAGHGRSQQRQMRPHERPLLQSSWEMHNGATETYAGSLGGLGVRGPPLPIARPSTAIVSPARRVLSSPKRAMQPTGDAALYRSRPSSSNPPPQVISSREARGRAPGSSVAVSWPGPENPLKRRSPHEVDNMVRSLCLTTLSVLTLWSWSPVALVYVKLLFLGKQAR